MSEEFNLHEAAEEIISNDSPEASTQSNETIGGDTQETAPQTTSTESKELNAEDILNKIGEEKEDPAQTEDVLNQINVLGLIHNGQPVKVENVNQLKELIQKGYDYTKKTMGHADEVKAWTENKIKAETEWKAKESQLKEYESNLSETILENKIAETILEEMKNSDPDLFEEFRTRYVREFQRQNQIAPELKKMDGRFEKLQGEIQSLRGEKQTAELTSIKQSWEKELTETQNKYAPQLAKLGVRVDWNKVQTIWASDASNKMTVGQALNAAYGEDIAKANQSYQKLLATKNKTNSAMLKRTGVGSNQSGQDETIDYGGNYEKLLRSSSQTM